ERFRVGCMSKVLITYALLRLVDSGKVRLDHLVSDYIAIAPETLNQTKIFNLVNHTLGLDESNVELLGRNSESLDNFIEKCGDLKRIFEPGEAYIYSTVGIVVASRIIELVTGKPWKLVVFEQVFQPLGISNIEGRLSAGSYGKDEFGNVISKDFWAAAPCLHAANTPEFLIDIEDLVKLAIIPIQGGLSNNGERYLSPKTSQLLTKTQVEINDHHFISGWASGWLAFPVRGVFGFITGTGGQHAFVSINMNLKEVVAVQCNTYPNFEFFDAVLKHYGHPSLFRPQGTKPQFDLPSVLGAYNSQGIKSEVYQENNSFFITAQRRSDDGGWESPVTTELLDSGLGNYVPRTV
ncbi:MAG: class A beta-lactamase-related serine hydrolase, partial [Sphingobacteriales bacterium]